MTEVHLVSAATAFKCGKSSIHIFRDQYDPYNPGNSLGGAQCRADGPFFGSFLLSSVNGVDLPKPIIIYGVPKMESLPLEIPPTVMPASYYLAQKWTGLNVMFFKYPDATGKIYVTCKTRGYIFARDYPGGLVFSRPLSILGVDTEGGGQEPGPGEPPPSPGGKLAFLLLVSDSHVSWSEPLLKLSQLPDQLEELADESLQSISFELCGSLEPSLVHYPFEIALKPLFVADNNGRIRPVHAPTARKYSPLFLIPFNPQGTYPTKCGIALIR